MALSGAGIIVIIHTSSPTRLAAPHYGLAQLRATHDLVGVVDLRRLRLHGLIERIPKTHRYRVTAKGLRIAVFYTRLYNRLLRTDLAIISPDPIDAGRSIAKSIRAAERAINTWYDEENLAA